jgi:four helix bundle protein
MTNSPSSTRARSQAPHERLRAWTACHELTFAVYRATMKWRRRDQDPLGEMIREAAMASGVKIGVGAVAATPREFRTYLDQSGGALARLEALLEVARDVDLLPAETYGELEALRDHAARLTDGLYRAVGKKKLVAQ